jgi:ribonuclease PH
MVINEIVFRKWYFYVHNKLDMDRKDKRSHNELRKIEITAVVNPHAEGSVEVSFGKTKILVTVTVEKYTPKWLDPLKGGWITAEYGMLPRSTHSRMNRDASAGKQGGRTLEIQRLIGRSLRQAIDLKKIPGI